MGLIGLYVTNRCNLTCEYCFATTKNLDIKYENACNFIEAYIDRGDEKYYNLLITGGEPLLYKYLKNIILFSIKIREINEIVVLTNGTLLNEEWMQFFKKNNISLHISLDSINENYHNKYRSKQNLIKENIDKIKKYKIKTTICMTLSYENIEEVDKMILYIKKMEYFMDLNLISLDANNKLSWENANSNQINQALEKIQEWSFLTGRISKGQIMKNILLNPSLKLSLCYNLKHTIIIDTDGNVYPCFINKDIKYGNIYDNCHDDIFNKKKEYIYSKFPQNCFNISCLGIYD